ncbi:MAG: 30S ribosomal protein S9 [Candidatus Levybacteria bacterium]|nr:30S ribosomal protein S9 [Candidatus Levybacteria bacterium]
MAAINPVVQKEKTVKRTYTHAVGRRREAVARVRLHKGAMTWDGADVKVGQVFVNHMPFEEYFKSLSGKTAYEDLLRSTNTATKYSFTVKVLGGGKAGQLRAVIHGVARSLVEHDSGHRPILKKKGLLTRDSRVRQRRKVGMGGKSRRKKQSPKR